MITSIYNKTQEKKKNYQKRNKLTLNPKAIITTIILNKIAKTNIKNKIKQTGRRMVVEPSKRLM